VTKRLKANVGATGKTAEAEVGGDVGKVIKNSAHEIWLAGLGAYSRAQQEGVKVFDALVKAGQDLQQRSQGAAGATVESTTGRAAGAWGKLEQVFEERVSRSLERLGVPSKNDLKALSDKIEELQESVQALLKEQGAAKKQSATTGGAPAKKSPVAKRAVKKATAKTPSPSAGDEG
jgi:poly(hydroxyalkanoate) granule-associated protein